MPARFVSGIGTGPRRVRSLSVTESAGYLMKVLVWIGIAMVIAWAILWLGVKMAMGAIHVLLVLGLVAIAWGVIKGASSKD